MTTTSQSDRPPGAPDAASGWLSRAWTSTALIPVLVLASFALGYLLYDVLGYEPETNDAPLWVDLVVAVVVLAVAVAPCLGAVVYGRRSHRAGDRRGLVPLVLGAIAGLALTVLTVVTTLADALA